MFRPGDVVTIPSVAYLGKCVVACEGLIRPNGTKAASPYVWVIPLDPAKRTKNKYPWFGGYMPHLLRSEDIPF